MVQQKIVQHSNSAKLSNVTAFDLTLFNVALFKITLF